MKDIFEDITKDGLDIKGDRFTCGIFFCSNVEDKNKKGQEND